MNDSIYTELADKFAKIGALFTLLAEEQTKSLAKTDEPAPAKRGRPAKAKVEEPAEEEPPKGNDTVVTPTHPKRAELKAAAKTLMGLTDKATAQKAVKLFGENTDTVPDCELADAVLHVKNLISKQKPAPADDEAI